MFLFQMFDLACRTNRDLKYIIEVKTYSGIHGHKQNRCCENCPHDFRMSILFELIKNHTLQFIPMEAMKVATSTHKNTQLDFQ